MKKYLFNICILCILFSNNLNANYNSTLNKVSQILQNNENSIKKHTKQLNEHTENINSLTNESNTHDTQISDLDTATQLNSPIDVELDKIKSFLNTTFNGWTFRDIPLEPKVSGGFDTSDKIFTVGVRKTYNDDNESPTFIVAGGAGNAKMMTSFDGINWEMVSDPTVVAASSIVDIAGGGENLYGDETHGFRWLTVGSDRQVMQSYSSSDGSLIAGKDWELLTGDHTTIFPGIGSDIYGVDYGYSNTGAPVWVIVGADGKIATNNTDPAETGLNSGWTEANWTNLGSTPPIDGFNAVKYGKDYDAMDDKSITTDGWSQGNLWIAVGNYGLIARSNDGLNWEQIDVSSLTTSHFQSIEYDDGLWVTITYIGEILTSRDGKNWTKKLDLSVFNQSVRLRDIKYGYKENIWIAFGCDETNNTGIMVISKDSGNTWTLAPTFSSQVSYKNSFHERTILATGYFDGLWIVTGYLGGDKPKLASGYLFW